MKCLTAAIRAVLLLLCLPYCLRAEEVEYFPKPLKGVLFEYSVRIQDPSMPETKQYKLTMRFEDEVEMDGKRYLKLVYVQDLPGATPTISLKRWAKDGIYQFVGHGAPLPTRNYLNQGGEFLWIPLPIAVGQEWSRGRSRCKAEGIEDVYLLNRTIKGCLKISTTFRLENNGDILSSTEDFYAPKLGFLKSISKTSNGIVRETVLEIKSN
jgi:hypothetical protein